MKIEIEWNCSYEAKLVIDGRELKVSMRPGVTSLEGAKGKVLENTVGGIIASELFGKIADFMQAEAVMHEATAWDPIPESTWRNLPNSVADAVYRRAT